MCVSVGGWVMLQIEGTTGIERNEKGEYVLRGPLSECGPSLILSVHATVVTASSVADSRQLNGSPIHKITASLSRAPKSHVPQLPKGAV